MTLPPSLLPAGAVASGLGLTLLLGLRRRSPAGAPAARALLLLSIAAALAALRLVPAAPSALLRGDGLGTAWQAVFLLAAVPLAAVMPMATELPAALAGATLIGMALVANANHLLLFFLGLELMSLPSYLLVYHLRRDRRALEAALKYFFAGSVGSAFFLFGASLFYGLTGTFAMDAVGATSPRLELAGALMGAGALFKVGAVPLHFWLPDVYEASAPELAGFFSTGVKAAALLILVRVLLLLPPAAGGLASALLPVSLVTMTLGNLLALRQTSLQRLLAYSSIAHVGYLLLALWAWSAGRPVNAAPAAPTTVYLYAVAYLFMSSGAFLALRAGGLTRRADLAGLARRRPGLAAFLALMLLSLASVPPTSGFLAKFFVFWEAVKADGAWAAAFAAANSVIGLGYYFLLIRDLYLAEPQAPAPPAEPLSPRAALVMAGCALPTLALGVWPGAWRVAAEWLGR